MKSRISKFGYAFLQVLTPGRIVIVAAVAAFFWFIVLGDKGIYHLEKIIAMKQRLVAERQQLNDEIDALTNEKELLGDPANLETVIRKELGYIRPGEVLFEDRSAAPAARNP